MYQKFTGRDGGDKQSVLKIGTGYNIRKITDNIRAPEEEVTQTTTKSVWENT
jgi:hypothetical protein